MHHPADVSDIVDGLIRCATAEHSGGRTYNLAGPAPIRFSDLRDVMAAAMGSASVHHRKSYPAVMLNLYYQAGRMSDRFFGLRTPLFESVSFITANRILDISRSRDEIGYVPKVSVPEAARRTAAWLKQEKLL
jgi:nucleoside-diphosphate-sugar epimerase